MAQPVDALTTSGKVNAELLTLNQKYIGNDVVVVSGTTSGYVTGGFEAFAPYANLSNRYYPTVAVYPNLGSNIVTKEQLGGYFLPKNIGASVYLAKNIIYSFNTSQITAGSVYNTIAPEKYNKGRGLTKSDQYSIVTHIPNNNWLKAIHVSDQYDGNIIESNTYQKFIPYQSDYETNKTSSNGVVNPVDNFEYWSGPTKNIWQQNGETNKLTELKYFDLTRRNTDLVVTPTQDLYSWQTDVFGTQYALYKNNLVSGGLYYKAKLLNGNLWVKTIDSTTVPAPSALNSIFNKYKNNVSIYNQLSNNTIINLEVFFDTIIIELTDSVLYEKITFNYDTYSIEPTPQNYLPVTTGTTTSIALSTQQLKSTYGLINEKAQTWFAGNWYDEEKKTITICTLLSSTLSGTSGTVINTSGISSVYMPALYRIDLNNPSEKIRIFPQYNTNFKDYVYTIIEPASARAEEIVSPVFTYNKDTNSYIVSFLKFTNNEFDLISYTITT